MCPRHEAAELVSRAGLSVRTTMCAICPLRDECGYLRQEAAIEAMDGIGLFFLASVGLAGVSPAPTADLLIVDERLAAEHVHEVSLDCLDRSTLPFRGSAMAAYTAAQDTLEAVRDALRHPDQLASLRGEGIKADHLDAAIALLRPLAEPAALPSGLTDKQLKAALAQRGDGTSAAADALHLLRAVAEEIEQPRQWLNGVTLPNKRGAVAVCRLQKVRGLVPGAAVLALDGTGNPEHSRDLFGARMEHVEARVERDAHVTSPLGRLYSRQSITSADKAGQPLTDKDGRPHAAKARAAAKLRGDIGAIVCRLPGPVLVVAAEQAETALVDHLPANTRSGHYGAIRGRNTWEDCAAVVTAGSAPIGLEAVERLARCHMVNDPEPFISSAGAAWPKGHPYRDRGWPFWCTRGRRMRDGSVQPIEIAIHPDLRVQAMLEQVREAEVVQAIDRTRPVRHHREVVALDSLVLDLTYDTCPSHRDLVAGGSPWERAMDAMGILPLGARDLAEARVFSTSKAAERALENTPRPQIEILFGGRGYLIAHYRRKGQRGRLSSALIDPARHPDPRAALALLLGDLAWLELEAPPPPIVEAAPTPPKRALRPILAPLHLPDRPNPPLPRLRLPFLQVWPPPDPGRRLPA